MKNNVTLKIIIAEVLVGKILSIVFTDKDNSWKLEIIYNLSTGID